VTSNPIRAKSFIRANSRKAAKAAFLLSFNRWIWLKLKAAHKLKAQGTRAEEESVPRHGWRGTSGQGWLKRLSDLTVFPKHFRTYR
jgi:hypothetical protein